MADIEEAFAEATKDPTAHYDASRENRANAAGFYQFSTDEATRARQMEELKKARKETEQARKESGLENLPAEGEVPLDNAKGKGKEIAGEGPAGPKITGRGIDKRKRELEERRKALDAKRRKTATAPNSQAISANIPTSTSSSVTARSPSSFAVAENVTDPADDFLARLEADLRKS